jgi:hypothetical protein
MYLFSMEPSHVYIIISIVVLAVIALLLFITGRNKSKEGLSKLAALSFTFIIAGIIFGENRLVGYSLLGVGVLLAVIDIYSRMTHQ